MDALRRNNFLKYNMIYEKINTMRVKDKRIIFGLMRSPQTVNADLFLPYYGFTLGDFAIFQILTENCRKRRQSQLKKQ